MSCFPFFLVYSAKNDKKQTQRFLKLVTVLWHILWSIKNIYQYIKNIYYKHWQTTLTGVSIANLGRLSRKKKKQKLTQPPSWSTLYPRKRKLRFHVKMPKIIIFLSRFFFFFNANCVQDFHTFTLTNYTSNRSGIYQGHRTSVFCSISVVRSKK